MVQTTLGATILRARVFRYGNVFHQSQYTAKYIFEKMVASILVIDRYDYTDTDTRYRYMTQSQTKTDTDTDNIFIPKQIPIPIFGIGIGLYRNK